MKQKILVFVLLALACSYEVNAQFYHDFTAVTPTGQTLYYTIHGDNVTIVNPYRTEGGAAYVSGDMIIPDSVDYTFENDSIVTVIDSIGYYNYVDILPNGDTIELYDTIVYSHDSIVYYQDTITYAVTGLYYSAFRYCDNLTSVVLPNGITSIPYCAFGDCTSLKSVTMGNAVTSINSWAFSGCFALQSLYVPESVTNISGSAFNAVRHIEYYGNATGAPWSAISMNGYKDGDFVYTNPSKKTLMAYIGEGGDVVIPETVDSIGYGAFYCCRSLNSVTIPDCVTWIGASAFNGCSELTSVTIPECVTSIGEAAFSGCSGLISVTINCPKVGSWFSGLTSIQSVTLGKNVASIGTSAFSGCSSLTSVIIPESVTSIGESAFYGTPWYNNQPDGLIYAGNVAYKYKGTMPENTTINIKDGTISIAYNAFLNCKGLAAITIPNSVVGIGSSAFWRCSSLTSITIPEGVFHIYNYSFYDCIGLKIITLPNSLKSISDWNFYGSTSLTDVYCFAKDVPETESGVFANCNNESVTLHVPASAIDDYKSKAPWNTFKEIVALTDEELTAIKDIDNGQVIMGNEANEIYDLQGHRLSNERLKMNNEKLPKGVYIVNGKKVLVK